MKNLTDVNRDALEYRESMQQAALAFLERHQAEYLGNDQLLFTRTVTHLKIGLGVPEYLAEKLAGVAYADLRNSANNRCLDLKNSTRALAVLTDPNTGETFTIPVELIFQHLVDVRDRRSPPRSPY
ncbi:hypothetical protein [Pseudomonas sp. UBA4194]|uniref:hypothetical protein n=1 Tax=Pseudomonas sp. UBA4194 TaxID=1947317 RepID=UPI0025DE6EF1|nr:hypothetical protein [Pseudomonas sp. UBA4194]